VKPERPDDSWRASSPSVQAESDPRSLAVDELVERMLADERTRERLRTLLAPPPVYTVSSLAEALRVSPKAISNAIRRGELDAVKRGGRWYISAEAVTTWTTRTSGPVLHRPAHPPRRPLLDAWGRDNVEAAP
jgi:excisionase family DNA binding protein